MNDTLTLLLIPILGYLGAAFWDWCWRSRKPKPLLNSADELLAQSEAARAKRVSQWIKNIAKPEIMKAVKDGETATRLFCWDSLLKDVIAELSKSYKVTPCKIRDNWFIVSWSDSETLLAPPLQAKTEAQALMGLLEKTKKAKSYVMISWVGGKLRGRSLEYDGDATGTMTEICDKLSEVSRWQA